MCKCQYGRTDSVCKCPPLFRVGDVCTYGHGQSKATVIAITHDRVIMESAGSAALYWWDLLGMRPDIPGYPKLIPPKRTRTEVYWAAVPKKRTIGRHMLTTEQVFDTYWCGNEQSEQYVWQKLTFEVPE